MFRPNLLRLSHLLLVFIFCNIGCSWGHRFAVVAEHPGTDSGIPLQNRIALRHFVDIDGADLHFVIGFLIV